MSESLIIIKHSPYSGRKSHEVLEAIMSLALFDVDHKVVFFGEGLLWLSQPQTSSNQKSLAKQLQALPMYGSDALFYCIEHIDQFLGTLAVNDIAQPIHLTELSHWLRSANKVEVF